ncbi:MAG: L-threonylcarbamoyladenylate synthase [Bacteroidia bacterium]
MAETGNDIELAAQLLGKGELVAIPTETVYGLAANALNKEAVLKIFQAKNRPFFDPLIIHAGSIDQVRNYVREFPQKALDLANAFWPGPLTLLLPRTGLVPDLVTSGLETVAVRIPDHPLTLELLTKIDFPLAAPSANPFGYVSPTSAAHVLEQLGDKIPYVLDGGPCSIGIESTIVGFENDETLIYRLGGLALEEIEKVAGQVKLQINQSSDPKAPGQLKSHYAPRKPLLMGDVNALAALHRGKKIGVISFTAPYPFALTKILSPSGNLEEAAYRLFAAMRELDGSDIDLIIAEVFPDDFLGRAINDRLRRASA